MVYRVVIFVSDNTVGIIRTTWICGTIRNTEEEICRYPNVKGEKLKGLLLKVPISDINWPEYNVITKRKNIATYAEAIRIQKMLEENEDAVTTDPENLGRSCRAHKPNPKLLSSDEDDIPPTKRVRKSSAKAKTKVKAQEQSVSVLQNFALPNGRSYRIPSPSILKDFAASATRSLVPGAEERQNSVQVSGFRTSTQKQTVLHNKVSTSKKLPTSKEQPEALKESNASQLLSGFGTSTQRQPVLHNKTDMSKRTQSSKKQPAAFKESNASQLLSGFGTSTQKQPVLHNKTDMSKRTQSSRKQPAALKESNASQLLSGFGTSTQKQPVLHNKTDMSKRTLSSKKQPAALKESNASKKISNSTLNKQLIASKQISVSKQPLTSVQRTTLKHPITHAPSHEIGGEAKVLLSRFESKIDTLITQSQKSNKRLTALKLTTDDISAILKELEKRVDNLVVQSVTDEADLASVRFPIKSLSDLETLDEELSDPGLRKKCVGFLSRKNTLTLGDSVRKIAKAVLCDEVAVLFSFTGHKGKLSLSDYEMFLTTFIDAVRTRHDGSDEDICRPFKLWLSKAKERLESRTETNEEEESPVLEEECFEEGQESQVFGEECFDEGQESQVFGKECTEHGQESQVFGEDCIEDNHLDESQNIAPVYNVSLLNESELNGSEINESEHNESVLSELTEGERQNTSYEDETYFQQ